MKKLKFYFIVFFIVCLFSKTKAQEVIATSGNHYENNEIQISWTLGEPVIETLSNENSTLTQGFHQSKLIVTAINEVSVPGVNITAYPNPTSDILKVEVKNVSGQDLIYTLYSPDGRMLVQKQMESDISEIPMYNYVSATYFLKVSSSNTVLKTFKIVKR